MTSPEITIIIPVYNAFDDALSCIKSVLLNIPTGVSVLVIDDASPVGVFSEAYGKISPTSPLKIVRNINNLGFVGTCNAGLRATSGDVILLNSDTIVTTNFVKKLQEVAYSNPKIATVTPLTNNGEICSVPVSGRYNDLPLALSVEKMGQLVEQVSNKQPIQIPTCVGFCVYIKREVFKAIGFLDELNFGAGYGEENDFSCRAQQAGYIDVLDTSTFIFHSGSKSFKNEKWALIEKNSETLRRKHPRYFSQVEDFWRSGILEAVTHRIKLGILKEKIKTIQGSILHILHNGPLKSHYFVPGGTELHVQDLIKINSNYLNWSLVHKQGVYHLSTHLGDFDIEFSIDASKIELKDLLQSGLFSLIHLHHTANWDFEKLVSAIMLHGRYIVSLHDFNFICPLNHLYTLKHKHCDGKPCESACGQQFQLVSKRRDLSIQLFKNAKKIIGFSGSTFATYEKILNTSFLNKQIIPHGVLVENNLINIPSKFSDKSPLKILFLGAISELKGAQILKNVTSVKMVNNVPLEWHVLGEVDGGVPKVVINHGRYSRPELSSAIKKISPHVVAILSVCPETFCYTLSESWATGVPAIVSDLGAPAERVRENGWGWIIPTLDREGVIKTLEEITHSWETYIQVVEKINPALVIGVITEQENYLELIGSIIGVESRVWSSDLVFSKISKFPVSKERKPPFLKMIASILIRRILLILDILRIKTAVKLVVFRVLPKSMISKVKSYK